MPRIRGRWSVFFFYPADFTFVCPTELGDVAGNYEELQKLGVDVYSVSTDTHLRRAAALKRHKNQITCDDGVRLAP